MKYTLVRIVASALLLQTGGVAQDAFFNVDAKGIQTFKTLDQVGRNQMIFISKAPSEDFIGTAEVSTAVIRFDPSNISKTIEGKFSVEVKSMTTGLKIRDSDMLGKDWLDADTYPAINFTVRKLEQLKSIDLNRIKGIATGNFTLHGVTKSISMPVIIRYMEHRIIHKNVLCDLLIVNANFSIKYSDYGVKGSADFVGSAFMENVNIEVNIYCSNGADAVQSEK